jgi:class 3 adenylate cyclase
VAEAKDGRIVQRTPAARLRASATIALDRSNAGTTRARPRCVRQKLAETAAGGDATRARPTTRRRSLSVEHGQTLRRRGRRGTLLPVQEPTLPSGTVTFLFTDIEGSTRLLRALGERYEQVLGEHQRLLRAAFAAHHGHEVDTQGKKVGAAIHALTRLR